MLYEMLTGITPFWPNTHADMYAKVLRDPLVFPEDESWIRTPRVSFEVCSNEILSFE